MSFDPNAIVDEISKAVKALPRRTTGAIRGVRQEFSRRLRARTAEEIYQVALALQDGHRWVGYELLYYHPSKLSGLDDAKVERLGQGMSGWIDVDTFGRYVSGVAWNRGLVSDEMIHRWIESPVMEWRRSALVSTVMLNLKAAGGKGDTARTLAVCEKLVSDREDLVVKALSWSLRSLVDHDREAVEEFLAKHDAVLAGRVKRETRTKLDTGRKNPISRKGRQGTLRFAKQ